MSSYHRGVALSTVLIVASILMLVALTVASLTVLDLTLASSFADGAQGDMLARAAVTQFIHEQSAVPASILAVPNRPDLVARYRKPVFPDGAPHLPGTVTMTFDNSQPWYSFDNCLSTESAAGWLDAGTENKSVPPLSYDLMLTVNTGRQTSHYEAIIGQRWPYALTSAGTIRLDSTGGTPSVIHGPVYVPDPQSGPLPITMASGASMTYGDGQPLLVDLATFGVLSSVFQTGAGFTPLLVEEPFTSSPPLDRVDTAMTSGTVVTPAGAAASVRYNVGVNLANLLQHPALPQCTPLRLVGVGTDDNNHIMYELQQNMVLGTSPDTNLPNPQYFSGTTFYVAGSLVNHGFVDVENSCGATTKRAFWNPYGVQLNNCTLYVDGDLDLSYGSANDSDPTQLPVALQGQNATLVVSGAIIIGKGSLIAAGDNAMVVYCQSIVANAYGSFQGLIVAENSAVFTPVNRTTPGLVITGAVICGGRTVSVETLYGSCGSEYQTTSPELYRGACLSSTTIQYDPRYLRTLHGCGVPALTLMRKLP